MPIVCVASRIALVSTAELEYLKLFFWVLTTKQQDFCLQQSLCVAAFSNKSSMSGVGEASLVLGIISSIISIIDATKQVYEAVEDEVGLPTNFKKSASKLPLISKLLEDAERYVNNAPDESIKLAFTPTLEDCKVQAAQLQRLFETVLPGEGASRWDRYVKAARTIGKGGRVESLIGGILDDLQLLATKFPEVITMRGKEQLTKAIEEVSKMEPSLPDDFEQMPAYAHYGSGAQNNNTGSGTQNVNSNTGSGQQYIAQTQNFVKNKQSFPYYNNASYQNSIVGQFVTIYKGAVDSTFPEDQSPRPIAISTLSKLDSELQSAIRIGAGNTARALLKQGASITSIDIKGYTALHWATQCSDAMIVKLVLDAGGSVHCQDHLSWTPLHVAARFNSAITSDLLLRAGAEIEAKAEDGCTPLHIAARYNRSARVLDTFITHGANVEAREVNQWTPLLLASRYQKIATCVSALIKVGSDTSAKCDEGYGVLHLAAGHNSAEVVRMLLQAGSNVESEDDDGWTALHWATRFGKVDNIQVLLDFHASTDAQDKLGRKPCNIAPVEEVHEEVRAQVQNMLR